VFRFFYIILDAVQRYLKNEQIKLFSIVVLDELCITLVIPQVCCYKPKTEYFSDVELVGIHFISIVDLLKLNRKINFSFPEHLIIQQLTYFKKSGSKGHRVNAPFLLRSYRDLGSILPSRCCVLG